MKIINISAILPIKGLKHENDINIVIQKEINKVNPNIEFVFFKWLPYVNTLLSLIKPKWKKYKKFHKLHMIYIHNYKTYFFPWIAPPTSNFKLNNFLVKINIFLLYKKIISKLKKEIIDSDIIISQTLIPDGVIANKINKQFNKPYIHVVRGKITDEIYNSETAKNILNNAKKIITPSPTAYNYLKNKYNNIELIPHGIEKDYFFTGNKDYSTAKFITVSSLLKLKNINKVIFALKKSKEKGLEFEYKIIGDGPEKEYLKTLVKKNNLQNEIKFLGRLGKKEVIKNLYKSNIFIMPSIPETLGRAFQEAAAARCLCIGHKNSGIDGLLEHNKSGLFVTKETLAETVEDVIINIDSPKYKSIIEESFNIMCNLTWEIISKRYINTVNKCKKPI